MNLNRLRVTLVAATILGMVAVAGGPIAVFASVLFIGLAASR